MLSDLGYSARTLLRDRGFSIVAILALALGIGANTALFSVVNGVILSPLPFPDADRIVRLYDSNTKQNRTPRSFRCRRRTISRGRPTRACLSQWPRTGDSWMSARAPVAAWSRPSRRR